MYRSSAPEKTKETNLEMKEVTAMQLRTRVHAAGFIWSD